MRRLIYIFPFLVFIAFGCAHKVGAVSGTGNGSGAVMSPSQFAPVFPTERFVPIDPEHPGKTRTAPGFFLAQLQAEEAEYFRTTAGPTAGNPDKTGNRETGEETGMPDQIDEGPQNESDRGQENEDLTIADPLEPFNRAMFTFNDRLYFWVLKPVSQAYNKVVPEPARVNVRNLFDNLGFPIRFVNNLVQANFEGAASELGRFTINTVWGMGGLLDPSSNKELDIRKYDADLGQTLGRYGVGSGFYIVYPVLGPSSARGTVELVGDAFLYPVTYLSPWYAWIGTRAYEELNNVSLRIGNYESLKEAAIDPYLALRDAYVQYREKKIRAAQERLKPGGVR